MYRTWENLHFNIDNLRKHTVLYRELEKTFILAYRRQENMQFYKEKLRKRAFLYEEIEKT